MSYTGQLIVEFNTPVKVIPLSEIDASQIGLSLVISDQRDQNEGFDINSLEFTAEAVYFDGTKVVIQVEFNYPHLISPDMNFPDLIELEFLKLGKESIF